MNSLFVTYCFADISTTQAGTRSRWEYRRCRTWTTRRWTEYQLLRLVPAVECRWLPAQVGLRRSKAAAMNALLTFVS